MNTAICTEPPHVAASDGNVIIRACSGESFALSVETAMQMSEQLIRSAARARAQRRMEQELPMPGHRDW